MKKFILFPVLFCCCHGAGVDAASYGVARTAAPVLNMSAFSSVFGGRDGVTLKTDRCGQVRELEFIALPGTSFEILGEVRDGATTVFRVKTEEYPMPPETRLYVDSRFIEPRVEKPGPRTRMLPQAAEILTALKASIGSPYVWGGNVLGGVPELRELFYGGSVPAPLRGRLALAGLDCSGLLYQATGGWTPRNTSQLVSFGQGMTIAGKSADEIAGTLEPLDLIVWNGHVVIVIDRDTAIESRLECGKTGNGGVVTTPLRQRLGEIMRSRQPVDRWPTVGKQRGIFAVRRWLPR
jgi:hypothetical protein